MASDSHSKSSASANTQQAAQPTAPARDLPAKRRGNPPGRSQEAGSPPGEPEGSVDTDGGVPSRQTSTAQDELGQV